MNYKKILLDAGKVLWKHKAIPAFFVGIFSLPVIIILILAGIFIFIFDPSQSEGLFGSIGFFIELGNPGENPYAPFAWMAISLLLTVFSYPCLVPGSIFTCKSVSLAVSDASTIDVKILFQTFFKFFWPVAAIFFVVGLVALGVAQVLILPSFVIDIVFSVPFICIFPALLFCFVPAFFLVQTAVEMLVTVIVIDELQLRDAFNRVWQITKANLRSFVFLTVLLLLIEFIFYQAVSSPFSVLYQAFNQFLTISSSLQDSSQFSAQTYKIMFGLSTLTMLTMAVAQALATTYHCSAVTLTYLDIKEKTLSTNIQPESI